MLAVAPETMCEFETWRRDGDWHRYSQISKRYAAFEYFVSRTVILFGQTLKNQTLQMRERIVFQAKSPPHSKIVQQVDHRFDSDEESIRPGSRASEVSHLTV